MSFLPEKNDPFRQGPLFDLQLAIIDAGGDWHRGLIVSVPTQIVVAGMQIFFRHDRPDEAPFYVVYSYRADTPYFSTVARSHLVRGFGYPEMYIKTGDERIRENRHEFIRKPSRRYRFVSGKEVYFILTYSCGKYSSV